MVISAHAYPWDVLGDQGFAERVHASEVDSVTLAASYHTTRAATPNHPSRRVVDVPYAALYRPVSSSVDWGRLKPLSFGSGDPFAEAVAVLAAADIKVNAWIVLAHNTRLGLLNPDLTVLNCYGERYPYALCPSWAEVRDHCTSLAVEAVRDVAVDRISLESCGQMGVTHLGCHDKTYFSAYEAKLLSICCCAACGIDPPLVRGLMQRAEEPPEELLLPRHRATDLLRAQVLDELPPGVPVTLHANADPWATGPSPGLTPTAASDVDKILLPCWPADARILPGAEAYISILPPFSADHVTRLIAEGASGLALYHLGLAASPSAKFAEIARLLRSSYVA
jgi:hypothetical protein